MSTRLDSRIGSRLSALAARGQARSLPRITNRAGVRYRLDDREVIGLCSNDYLALADHPALVDAEPVSPGATASRLVAGDLELHRALEAKLAEHVGAADAVLFPSGFQLNVGVLPALLERSDHAYSDALNHASLIDGLRLAAAPRSILPHGATPPETAHDDDGLSWWITEAIFSMDGDRADPNAMLAHLERGGCVYLDEAHGYGLFRGGLGLAGSFGVQPTATVYTLGKAVGCAGAFVAGSARMGTWLRARARSFVFTTGLSPLLAARISHAIDLVRGPVGEERRRRLWDNVDHLARLLGTTPAPSPIFPVFVGDDHAASSISDALTSRGWHVQPIRPPTVPEGTARLRIAVSAGHHPDQLERFTADLAQIFHRHDLPLRIVRAPTSVIRDRAVGVP